MRRLWRRWRTPWDQCEVCGRVIRWPRRKVEITAMSSRHTEYGFGGGGITATYCMRHDPRRVN